MAGGSEVERGRLRFVAMLLLGLAGLAAASAASAARAEAAPPYPEAVLLVSGFETETPFTTPDPACNGKEGSEWNPPGGIAETLKADGYEVFTAPVSRSDKPTPPPCPSTGSPLPSSAMEIVSDGETSSNGAALAKLIAFLRDSYGVADIHIVAHSDGGLWSRSGITQNATYAGVTIQSLTTLGTPHTGSYLADLALELAGGKCDFSNRTEERICEALEVLADLILLDLGPIATYELSNDFLTTWNPQQTIGGCPVSVIAGDHVDFGIPFLDYYTPSDGLVGLASAQARDALDLDGHIIPAPPIPDLREAGVFDVVHGASVSFLSKKTLLNQQQISTQVADNTLLTGAEPCNVPDASDAGGEAQRLRAPLYRMVAADRRGNLPDPGAEDFVVSKRRVTVRCGLARLEPVPLLGRQRLRVHDPRRCADGLRARRSGGRGGGARALLLRAHPRRDVLVRVKGDRARIRVRGRSARRVRAAALVGGRWERLPLDRRGRVELPATDGATLPLRVRARGRAGGRPADTAHVALAR